MVKTLESWSKIPLPTLKPFLDLSVLYGGVFLIFSTPQNNPQPIVPDSDGKVYVYWYEKEERRKATEALESPFALSKAARFYLKHHFARNGSSRRQFKLGELIGGQLLIAGKRMDNPLSVVTFTNKGDIYLDKRKMMATKRLAPKVPCQRLRLWIYDTENYNEETVGSPTNTLKDANKLMGVKNMKNRIDTGKVVARSYLVYSKAEENPGHRLIYHYRWTGDGFQEPEDSPYPDTEETTRLVFNCKPLAMRKCITTGDILNSHSIRGFGDIIILFDTPQLQPYLKMTGFREKPVWVYRIDGLELKEANLSETALHRRWAAIFVLES